MKEPLKNLVLSLVDNYNSNEAEYNFELLKDKAEKEKDFDYALCAFYFDHEPNISYLLYKESYKLILLDSIEDINKTKEQKTKDVLWKMLSNMFGTICFNAETEFLSKAASDAYKEVLKSDFDTFLELSFNSKKTLILKILERSNEPKPELLNFYKSEFKESVYKNELDNIINGF